MILGGKGSGGGGSSEWFNFGHKFLKKKFKTFFNNIIKPLGPLFNLW